MVRKSEKEINALIKNWIKGDCKIKSCLGQYVLSKQAEHKSLK